MDSPEVWRWIWLVTATAFALGEIATTGFFMLPVAIGAGAAAILAFLGVSVAVQWVAFVVVSAGCFFALRPIARRLDEGEPTEGIGSKRLIGEIGTVLETIPGDDDLGLIRVHREEWRAQSGDGSPIAGGDRVRVVEVTGTRVVVFPASTPSESTNDPSNETGPTR
jgi:membrane protein implicated in regulation of membrane protease activity